MDDVEQGSEQDRPADQEQLVLHDGDILKFPAQTMPGKGQRKPLSMQFEIEVATGPRGEALQRLQAAAIQNILCHIANQRQQQNKPDPDSPAQ